jgi:urease accessory protein
VKKSFSKNVQGKSWAALRLVVSFVFPVLFLLAFLASQIVRHDSIGWSNGFNHPLTGWDHLVTMLAVGIWAAQLRGQAIWLLPLAFVGVMSLGGIAGAAGIAVPSVEGIILLSCAVFSVLITRKVRFGTKINVTIVAFFAFFHGFAHGQEISASAGLVSYILGFVLATLLLHGAGILAAKLVIVCAASLFGLIFSSSVLAKAGYSSQVGYHGTSALASAEKDGFAFLDLGQFYGRSRCLLVCDPPDFESYVANKPAMGEQRLSICRLRLQTTKKSFKSLTGRCADLGVAKVPDQRASDGGSGLPVPALASPFVALGLWFNAFYPDINNTPGLLLSNGVGSTSPPNAAAQQVKIPQVSNRTRSSLFFTIEAFKLQWIFIQIIAGNLLCLSIVFDAPCLRAFKHLPYLIPNRIRLPNSLRLPLNYRSELGGAITLDHSISGVICKSTWAQVIQQQSIEFTSQWNAGINLTKKINLRRINEGSL